METKLFHGMEGRTDRQTDMAKLIIAFSNFANTPKNAKLGDKLC